jgi:hypothetical protein
MDSTPNLKQNDPHDVLTAREDEALEQIYEQITRAEKQLSQRKHDTEPHFSDPQLPIDTLRPSLSRNRRALGGHNGLLLAAFIFVAVTASLWFYRDAANSIIVQWVPQLISISSKLLEKSGLPERPSPSTVRAAAAESTPPQPAPLPQTTPQDVATTTAPLPPEVAQLLQAMSRDLSNVKEGIEQLKTSQAQLARDNAQIVEQVKASQEQLANEIAKVSAHDLRPKTPAPPTRTIATSTSKPVQTPPLPQSTTRPQAPSQLRAPKP